VFTLEFFSLREWWGAGTGCSEKLWMPHPWRCSRPGWMGPWATWSSSWQPYLWHGGWNLLIFEVPSNPSHLVTLWNILNNRQVHPFCFFFLSPPLCYLLAASLPTFLAWKIVCLWSITEIWPPIVPAAGSLRRICTLLHRFRLYNFPSRARNEKDQEPCARLNWHHGNYWDKVEVA